MISKEVEYAKRRMQQKWYEFVMEEQRGGEIPVLERMYSAYMLAVEEFNRYSAVQQSEQQTQPKPTKKSVPPVGGAGKKKAS
jgi:hypothetical protein